MSGITHIAELKKPVLQALAKEVDKNALEIQDDILGFLPDEPIYDLEFAGKIVRNSSQIAGMIGFGSEPPVRDKDQVAQYLGEVAKRSEERRVGKECRCGWWGYHENKSK